MSSTPFQGKTALVTGAAAGMGFATARRFAELGAKVTLADIDETTVSEAAAMLADAGHEVLAVTCDVTDEQHVRMMVEKTVDTFGSLDAAFNNAGVQTDAVETADASFDEYDRVMSINLFGVWCCMKYELQQMRQQGSGAIVNCSSLGGLVGPPGRSIYHGAKHGVVGMTKSSALEYAARGIRINAVCPGVIDTPMVSRMVESGDLPLDEILKEQPIGRLGRPEEIAAAVTWLCGPDSTFVIGHSLPVDGGFTAH